MSDFFFMTAFLSTLREIPLDAEFRRCPDSVGLKQFGFRDIIVCGDIRQLPPASGIAPFWSSWVFQNMFEYFVLREDRRHERDPSMQRLKECASSTYIALSNFLNFLSYESWCACQIHERAQEERTIQNMRFIHPL